MRSADPATFINPNSGWFLRTLPSSHPTIKKSLQQSGSDRCLIQASTVRLPSIAVEIRDRSWPLRVLIRCSPLQGVMCAMTVEVVPELEQLVLEIHSRPEQEAIQILVPNRSDQSLHKGMRQRNVGYRLDFGHLQNSQIGLPLPKSIQRIVVGAEVLRHRPLASNGLIEHSAECDTVDYPGLDTESNDPARVLIHDHQDPVGP